MPPSNDPNDPDVHELFAALREMTVRWRGSLATRVKVAIERFTERHAMGPSVLQLIGGTLIQALNLLGGLGGQDGREAPRKRIPETREDDR